jgi:hypothetical protein
MSILTKRIQCRCASADLLLVPAVFVDANSVQCNFGRVSLGKCSLSLVADDGSSVISTQTQLFAYSSDDFDVSVSPMFSVAEGGMIIAATMVSTLGSNLSQMLPVLSPACEFGNVITGASLFYLEGTRRLIVRCISPAFSGSVPFAVSLNGVTFDLKAKAPFTFQSSPNFALQGLSIIALELLPAPYRFNVTGLPEFSNDSVKLILSSSSISIELTCSTRSGIEWVAIIPLEVRRSLDSLVEVRVSLWNREIILSNPVEILIVETPSLLAVSPIYVA